MSLDAAWDRAALARDLVLVAPGMLGGLWLRCRAGPVRDRFLAPITELTQSRVHPSIGDDALFGGLDMAATLAEGRLVRTKGLLESPGLILLTMAERAPASLAARLANALDAETGLSIIALDEGADEDERLPDALGERLALHVDLGDLAYRDAHGCIDQDRIAQAKSHLLSVTADDAAQAAVTLLALQFGIESLRAPVMCLRAAKVHAALSGRTVVQEEDIANAAALVLVPRATQLPAIEDDDVTDPERPQPDQDDTPQDQQTDQTGLDLPPEELTLAAVKALLPRDLLDRLAAQQAARAIQAGAGAGSKKRGNRRGRPLPARPGKPSNGARVDLISTLRRAAPWQKVRQAQAQRDGLQIRARDIQLKQFEERSDRAVIFVVDASGSAALARLAEAKGAVELLLAQAYARRDYVALLAFRGVSADLLLPPTRSLVQTKRRLAELPGGGGTPLAAGLQDALSLAETVRGRGMSPALAVLTDGRANVALDGTGNRALAGEEARQMAKRIRGRGIPSLVIDTGLRPSRGLDALAHEMGAGYLPLPRADAASLSQAVDTALSAA